jgi:hypothetical protein
MLHHETQLMGGRPWERYTGSADGAWTTLYSGSSLNPGAVGTYPNALSSPSTGPASVGMMTWATGRFGSTDYYQLFSINGTSVAAVGSVQSAAPSGACFPTMVNFADSAWAWTGWSQFGGSSNFGGAVGFPYNASTGLGASQIGDISKMGSGVQPLIRNLDSTRCILSGGVSGAYAGALIQQRAGTAMGAAGAFYNPNNESYGWFYATPVTASVSICNQGHYATGTTALQIGAVSHAAATISSLVAPATVATVTGNLSVSASGISTPLDGIGTVPGRIALLYTDGTAGITYAILIKWDGVAITAGAPVALTGLGTARTYSGLFGMGGGTLMAVDFGGNIVPIYYNQNNVSDLSLNISPACLKNAAPFNHGLGTNAYCLYDVVSQNRMVAFGGNNTSSGNGTTLQCKIICNGLY